MFAVVKSTFEALGWSNNRLFLADSFALLLATPLLIFPSRFPLATAAICLLLLISFGYQLFFQPWVEPVSPFSVLFLLFGLTIVAAMLVSADADLTLEKGAGILLGLVMWRWSLRYVQHPLAVQLLIALYVLVGLFFILVGFLAVDWLLKVPQISAILQYIPQQVISFSAIGSNQGVQPNQLAGTILWVFPVLLAWGSYLWMSRVRWLSGLVFIGALTILSMLLLSQSRGGWLGGLAAAGTFVWLLAFLVDSTHWYRHMRWGWPLLVIIGIGFVVATLGFDQILQAWSDPPDQTLVGDLGTLTFRQEVWTWAIQGLRDFPLTGPGLGTFRTVVHRLYPIALPETYDIAHAHNVFLQIGLDTGLPGLLVYLAILTIYAYLGVTLLGRPSEYRLIVVGLLAAMAGFHIYGLLDTISIGAKPGLLFWLLLALMDGVWRVREKWGEGVLG